MNSNSKCIKKLICLFLVGSAFVLQANSQQDLVSLNPVKIKNCKKQIIQLMKKNRQARIALFVGAGIVTVGVGAKLWHGYQENKRLVEAAVEENKKFHEAAVEENKKFLEAAVKKFMGEPITDLQAQHLNQKTQEAFIGLCNREAQSAKDNPVITNAASYPVAAKTSFFQDAIGTGKSFVSFVWQQAWIGFFTTHLMAVSANATMPLIQGYKTVYHDGDLNWFLSHKTYVKTFFTELEEVAQELVLANDDQEVVLKKEAFILLEQRLMYELEKTIAFMEYQKSLLQKTYPFAANSMQVMIKHTMEEINRFVLEAEKILADPVRYVELPACVKNFHRKYNSHKRSFIAYEKSPEEAFIV